jgi:hypothetical protein
MERVDRRLSTATACRSVTGALAMIMVPSVIFDALGFAVIVAAIVFIFRNPTPSGVGAAGIMAVVAFVCLFIGSIDRIESFKASASGIEAKTREVQQVLDSAKATVSSLNELAKDIAAMLQSKLIRLQALTGSALTPNTVTL